MPERKLNKTFPLQIQSKDCFIFPSSQQQIKRIILYFFIPFFLFYFANMNTKLFILAFGLAPIFSVIEKYFWDDWSFLMFMVILVAIDTASGMLFAFKEHKFSSKKMQSLLIKIVVYGLTLITVHIMSAFTVKNQPNSIMSDILPYLDSVMYSFLVFREVLSINENFGKLGYPMLPKFVLKRFEDFDENGTPIKKNDNNNGTPTNL